MSDKQVIESYKKFLSNFQVQPRYAYNIYPKALDNAQDYLINKSREDYLDLFGNLENIEENPIGFKFVQFYLELPKKRDELRKIVRTPYAEELKIKYIFVGKPSQIGRAHV